MTEVKREQDLQSGTQGRNQLGDLNLESPSYQWYLKPWDWVLGAPSPRRNEQRWLRKKGPEVRTETSAWSQMKNTFQGVEKGLLHWLLLRLWNLRRGVKCNTGQCGGICNLRGARERNGDTDDFCRPPGWKGSLSHLVTISQKGLRVHHLTVAGGFPEMVKNLPSEMRETPVRSLGPEDALEKGMATHSGILDQIISWTEEPGGL